MSAQITFDEQQYEFTCQKCHVYTSVYNCLFKTNFTTAASSNLGSVAQTCLDNDIFVLKMITLIQLRFGIMPQDY